MILSKLLISLVQRYTGHSRLLRMFLSFFVLIVYWWALVKHLLINKDNALDGFQSEKFSRFHVRKVLSENSNN